MLIQKGAEAEIHKEGEIVRKVRIKKSYRIPQLDERLREERTRFEARMIQSARRTGILAPKIFDVQKYEIRMEWIDGERVKEYLFKASKKDRVKIYTEIGHVVATLHRWGIIHGDLTTSNFIVKENHLWLIDFGLGKFSRKIEDQAIDLWLLYEAIKATHFKFVKEAWKEILKEYKANYSNAISVLSQLEKIRQRRRYM